MNQEAHGLRMGIKAGWFPCHCPRPMRQENEELHRHDCQWMNAVMRIYELERAEDAKR